MATKKVNLIISLKDGVSGKLGAIKNGFASVSNVISSVAKAGTVALAGLGVAVAAVGAAVKKSFEFETARTQLKGLLGSVEEANERFVELRDFAASTPFQLPDLLEASKQLTVFTEGALGSADSLRNIGDAAATTGNNIGDVSFWVGRAYSMLKGGKPFGEAAMRLQEMGILTPKVREEMESLQASGASFEVVWSKLNGRLDEFSGGMEDLSQTGEGLFSTLVDNWGIALATFGDEFAGSAKEGIVGLTEAIKTLTESGAITSFAEAGAKVFNRWAMGVAQLADQIKGITNMFTDLKSVLAETKNPFKIMGALREKSAGRRAEAEDTAFEKALEERKKLKEREEKNIADLAKMEAAEKQRLEKKAAEEKKKADADAAKKAADEKEKLEKKVSKTTAKAQVESLKTELEEAAPEIAETMKKATKATVTGEAVKTADMASGAQLPAVSGAGDLFRQLKGESFTGSSRVIDQMKEIFQGKPEEMASALSEAISTSEPLTIQYEALEVELGEMKELMEEMLKLHEERLGGVLN